MLRRITKIPYTKSDSRPLSRYNVYILKSAISRFELIAYPYLLLIRRVSVFV
jgi:hypothetical protein